MQTGSPLLLELAGAAQDSEAFLDVYHEGSWEAAYEEFLGDVATHPPAIALEAGAEAAKAEAAADRQQEILTAIDKVHSQLVELSGVMSFRGR